MTTTRDKGAGRDTPLRVGIINDYLRIPYANGSSFASLFFYRELTKRGHRVTVIGPRDPDAKPEELPPRYVALPSMPLRNHPGVQLAFPSRRGMRELAAENLDVVLGQTGNELMESGVWLRYAHDVPLLPVNTIHLPSVYNILVPDILLRSRLVDGMFADGLVPFAERQSVHVYNHSDGLVVLSEGLKRYWEKRGVTTPIHVIPRPIEPKIFDVAPTVDPFPVHFPRGARVLLVCRHVREKGVSRVLSAFAEHVAPRVPEATLTLVGDGPDHDRFRDEASRLGIAHRTHFTGEFPVTQIPAFYRFADLFVYASLSETYGQVVSEALWCGLPVVALADDMGVSQQVVDGRNGVLIPVGDDAAATDARFGAEIVTLLRQPTRRQALGRAAREIARERSDPQRCMDRVYAAMASAKDHCVRTKTERLAQPFRPLASMASWTWIHLALAGLGLLRPPQVIDRHHRGQPTWRDFMTEPPPRPTIDMPARELPAIRMPAEMRLRARPVPNARRPLPEARRRAR